MEDQQPAAGDLTADAAVATDVIAAAEADTMESDAVSAETDAAEKAGGREQAQGGEAAATRKKGRRIRNRRFTGKRFAAVATEVGEATEVDTKQSEAAASDESADAATESAEAVVEETEADAAEDADGEQEAQDESKDEVAKTTEAKTLKTKTAKTKTAKKRRARPKRVIGKRFTVAVAVVATLLFVGSAAFAGASMQEYLSERAAIATKLNVARTAANAITTLWSYTPENMDTLPDRAANYLSGDFAAQYRKFVDAIAAPNKQAKISSNTQVTGAAVETLDGPNAIAIVYTNTTSSSALKKNIPSLKYLSYRVMLKRDHGRWLVTRMTTVTQLDITPRL